MGRTSIDAQDVRAALDAVIAAMKQTGAWQVEKPEPAAFADMGAFGTSTMAFEQWLRFVFVPNVEALVASNGPWPDSSQVAAHATREGDGNPGVAELVPALQAFDALFEPDAGEDEDHPDDDDDDDAADNPPSPASQAYERSRAALARNDHARALDEIRAAVASDPNLPNAQNFAGWVLYQFPGRSEAQLDEAIARFREAMKLAPADPVPPVNLCDALAAAGRDAVAEAERMTASAQPSVAAAAHYWLGWHHKGQPDTNDRAIDHLRHAIQGRWRWGLAHANLAHALEMAHRSDEAYQQHGTALDCDDDFDRAFSHERRAAYEARHGWLRNALRSFRAALREDRKRGGEREITYRDAIAWLEQQLRAAGIEPATPDRDGSDERWLRACALELPAGFGARNEAGEPLADDVIEVERLVRAERWEAAVHQLELLRRADLGKLFDAAGYAAEGAEAARRTGHRAHALAMLRLVLEAYRAHASWATSGAEAMGRMVDVDRISAQLVSWESEGK